MTITVLVVDDVVSMRRLLREFLDVPGLDVTFLEAASGEEAIRILDDQRVDIVVSDQRMGAVNGIQVLKHAREHQPHAMRCLLTGYADPELAAAAMREAKVDVFLEKPMDSAAIGALLQREVLDRYRQMPMKGR